METEPREVGAEAALAAGDAEIRHAGEAEPAADRRPLHRGDDRLLRAEQPDRLLVQMPTGAFVAHVAAGEVGAGAEGLALRRQHQGAHRGVGIRRLEGGGDLLDQGDVEEVVGRALDLDRGHVAGSRYADAGEGHEGLAGWDWVRVTVGPGRTQRGPHARGQAPCAVRQRPFRLAPPDGRAGTATARQG